LVLNAVTLLSIRGDDHAPCQLLRPIRLGHGRGLLLLRHHARLLHCPHGFLRWHGRDLWRRQERFGGQQGGGRGGRA
jgi:hypothetical protein